VNLGYLPTVFLLPVVNRTFKLCVDLHKREALLCFVFLMPYVQ
jgi:hypothetical protein